MINLRAIIYGLAGVGIGFLAGIWYPHETTKPVGVATEAPQAKILAAVTTEKIDCKPVVVYREAAKAKTALPKTVQDDPTKHVTSATTVQPGLRPVLITSLYDETTGKTFAYSTPMALPWLAANKRGHVGVGYGWTDAGQAVGIEAQQGIFKSKSIAVVGRASADLPIDGGQARWKVMAYGLWEFD